MSVDLQAAAILSCSSNNEPGHDMTRAIETDGRTDERGRDCEMDRPAAAPATSSGGGAGDFHVALSEFTSSVVVVRLSRTSLHGNFGDTFQTVEFAKLCNIWFYLLHHLLHDLRHLLS